MGNPLELFSLVDQGKPRLHECESLILALRMSGNQSSFLVVCRNDSLYGLMDRGRNFPAEPFASSAILLDALKRVSLQSSVTPTAALQMACFVQTSSKQDPQQAHTL